MASTSDKGKETLTSTSDTEEKPSPPWKLCKGMNGLDKVVLTELQGSSVEIYLYGGQVTSWKNERNEELLFASSKATFKPPKPIRLGIALCFPQVESPGNLEKHEFIRNRFWTIDLNPPPLPQSNVRTFVDLIFKPTLDDYKFWPHSYEFRLRVALAPGGNLILTSRIRNISDDGKPFSFTFAYHTYFTVSDVSEVRVEGLETLHYLDNLKEGALFTEQIDGVTFETEMDRVYLRVPSEVAIIDHQTKKTYVMWKEGLPDAVLWNPWDKKSKTIPDLGKNDYRSMVCLAAACIRRPITLKPGQEWKGGMELTAVDFSSYYNRRLVREGAF